MGKRRYSEDFYSEIDSLIKIHQEKSVKRFEMIEVAQSSETESKNQSKYGYTPPPTFWEVASSNKLLKYALVFIGILFVTLMVSVGLSARMRQNNELVAKNTEVIQHAENKGISTGENKIDLSSSHETLKVSVKPVPENWGKPQAGILKTYKDDNTKLKEMDNKSFSPQFPGEPAVPIPDNIDKSNLKIPVDNPSPANPTDVPGNIVPHAETLNAPDGNVPASGDSTLPGESVPSSASVSNPVESLSPAKDASLPDTGITPSKDTALPGGIVPKAGDSLTK